MLTELLQNYDFTAKEAKIYLTCLEVGNAPASSIARRAEENRVTTYSVLKALMKKGIAHEHKKGNTSYYRVIEPDQIFAKQKEKLELFEKKMPELMALANIHINKPKIQYFEGVEGIKLLYNTLLTSTVPGESFLGDSHIDKDLEQWLDKHFVPARIKKGIFFRVIVANKEQNKYYYKVSKKHLIQKKYIPSLSGILQGEIMLYGPGKVAISMDHNNELAGLIIESNQFYQSMKGLFDFIWNTSGTQGNQPFHKM